MKLETIYDNELRAARCTVTLSDGRFNEYLSRIDARGFEHARAQAETMARAWARDQGESE